MNQEYRAMEKAFEHKPVLLKEMIEGILTKIDGIYLDCTLGGAGHTEAILQKIGPNGRIIGIDQDQDAITAATDRLIKYKNQIQVVKSRFDALDKVLDSLEIDKVDGILFDLGVSSYQLDQPERGFSYMHEGRLDMRMDISQELTAAEIVNTWTEEALARIFFEYGEERWSRRIAAKIVEQRSVKLFQTTTELSDAIKYAIPAAARREGPHPAKRTFQALRIAVNDELGIIERTLRLAIERLNSGGRVAVITFHSLEDRIVKTTFASLLGKCTCPPRSPICTCNNRAKIRLLGKGITPTNEEIAQNPRSRSARLRIAEKL